MRPGVRDGPSHQSWFRSHVNGVARDHTRPFTSSCIGGVTDSPALAGTRGSYDPLSGLDWETLRSDASERPFASGYRW